MRETLRVNTASSVKAGLECSNTLFEMYSGTVVLLLLLIGILHLPNRLETLTLGVYWHTNLSPLWNMADILN